MTASCEQQARDMLGRLGYPDAQSLSTGDVVELANLIARASTFKEGVAYMPVPRCDGCRQWRPFELEDKGICVLVSDPPERHYPRALGDLETRADFGCVQHEEK